MPPIAPSKRHSPKYVGFERKKNTAISVAAVPPQRVPASESRAAVARNLEAFLNRRADKVNGLPEEEIDAAIDEAVHAVRHNRT
jgi:hypothetical protein